MLFIYSFFPLIESIVSNLNLHFYVFQKLNGSRHNSILPYKGYFDKISKS
jgi:hypothetical protein